MPLPGILHNVLFVHTIRNTFAHIVFRLSDWYHRVSLNRFNHIQENYDQMVLGRKPYSYIFLVKCFPVKCTLCQYAEFEGSTCSPSEIHLLIANLINVPFPSVGRGQRLWLWVFERHRWEPRLCDQPRVWARNPPGGTIIFSLLMKRFHFLDFNALIFCV